MNYRRRANGASERTAGIEPAPGAAGTAALRSGRRTCSSFLFHRLAFIVCCLLTCSSAVAQQTKPNSALAAADSILQQMSRITGLPVKAPLSKQLISKSEIEKYLKENLHAEYTPAEVHGQEAALKAFGVVGPDFNLEAFLVSFYTEQAAGFYDPRRRTMFMADWIDPDQQKIVLAHELTHALQDQSFDLWKFMHATRDNDDSTAAREAVVEGYATLAMVQTMLGGLPADKLASLAAVMDAVVNQQMTGFPVFSSAPFFLRFETLFPYTEGLKFVLKGFELGGWRRLNEVFLHPPVSTEQIFEPDRYFNSSGGGQASYASSPLALPAPPALENAPGVRRVEANTMGELGYRGLLGQLVSEDEAQQLGGSWRGDTYLVYEGPVQGEFSLIARTRWADPDAVGSFCRDYQTILENRWKPSGANERSKDSVSGAMSGAASDATTAANGPTPEILLETHGPRRAILLREGNECRWAEGVPASQADVLEKWLRALGL